MTWKIPTEFPDLSSAPIIGVDVETRDPNLLTKGPGGARNDGYLLGVAIATDDFNCYFPLRHQSGDNCDVQRVVEWLKATLKSTCPKVGANILYDLEWLLTDGIVVNGPKYDIQIAEWLLEEDKFKYNLESLCKKYLGHGKSEEKLELAAERLGIKDIKGNLWQFHPKDVAEYGAADAKDALDIFKLQVPLLVKDELEKVFYEIESPIIDVLLAMRFKGVPVDVKKAEELRDVLQKRQGVVQGGLNAISGEEVDVWSGKDIGRVATKLGLPFDSTAKGNPSFASAWLDRREEAFYKMIKEVRRLDRSGSVFIQSKILEMEKNGKVYPTFRQSKTDDGGTKSGRFASANPNAQQVPSRDEELAPLIRSLFIPEPGCRWLKADYKQQEPRVTVHYANIAGMTGGKEAVRRYVENPETDYHQMVADMANIPRSIAKTMNLGLSYGMGKEKMAAALGVDIEGATNIYYLYHNSVPFIKALADKAKNVAEDRGYIKTIAGRRRRFDLWGPAKYGPGVVPKRKQEAIGEFGYPIVRYFTYRAMNALIQGSSADMLKLAMIDLFKAGYVPSLTVHDELDDSTITEDRQIKEYNDIMIECMNNHGMPLTVPLLADVFIGPSWGEAKLVKV